MRDEILKERCELFSEPILRGYVLQKIGEEEGLIDEKKFILIEEHLKNCKFCSFCVDEIKGVLAVEKVDVDRRDMERSKSRLLTKISDFINLVSAKNRLVRVFDFFESTTGFLTFISIIVVLVILPLFFFNPFKVENSNVNLKSSFVNGNYKKSGMVVISPNGVINTNNPILFKWYPVFEAEKYKLKIFDENGNVIFSTSTIKPEFILKDNVDFIFMNGEKFYWRVYALNGDNEIVEKSTKVLILPER